MQAVASETDEATGKLDEAEALAIDAALYADSYRVSKEEAARRLLLMHGTGDQVAALEAEFGATLAGVYFDNGPEFGLKVRLKQDNAPPDRVLTRRAERLELRAARRAELEAAKAARMAARSRVGVTEQDVAVAERLIQQNVTGKIAFEPKAPKTRRERQSIIQARRDELARTLDDLEMVVDDEQTGEAVVYVRRAAGDTKAKAEQLLDLPVRVIEIPSGIQPVHTRGGSVLERQSDGVHNCMTGFIGRRSSDNALGAITAGHCFDSGDPAQNYTDRDTSNYAVTLMPNMYRNDSQFDLAMIIANHTTTLGEFYADPTGAARTLTLTKSRSGTAVRAGTTKGSYICHLGQTSRTDRTLMQTCGEVTSVNGANHMGGSSYVIVTNTQSGAGTVRTSGLGTLRCIPGDSGGPWFAYTTGYGVMSACSWNSTNNNITEFAVYTSLDYVQFLGGGASVVTN